MIAYGVVGRTVMAVTFVVGSLPLVAGAEILSATTISGTMVLGLAIGEGTYGSLLGINVAATLLVVAGFFAGALIDRWGRL